MCISTKTSDSLHPRLKFTVEQNQNLIHFFDIKIKYDNEAGVVEPDCFISV